MTSAITGDDRCVGPSDFVHDAPGNFGGPAAAAGEIEAETAGIENASAAAIRALSARTRRRAGEILGARQKRNAKPLVGVHRMDRTEDRGSVPIDRSALRSKFIRSAAGILSAHHGGGFEARIPELLCIR